MYRRRDGRDGDRRAGLARPRTPEPARAARGGGEIVHDLEGYLYHRHHDELRDAGLTLQDFDYYEIHEAFAAQVLCTLAAWESPEFCRERLGLDAPLGAVDRAKLNVKGSSIAVGHPFAATGARVLSTLAKLLAQDATAQRGLISVCTAGGMGVTAIVERA